MSQLQRLICEGSCSRLVGALKNTSVPSNVLWTECRLVDTQCSPGGTNSSTCSLVVRRKGSCHEILSRGNIQSFGPVTPGQRVNVRVSPHMCPKGRLVVYGVTDVDATGGTPELIADSLYLTTDHCQGKRVGLQLKSASLEAGSDIAVSVDVQWTDPHQHHTLPVHPHQLYVMAVDKRDISLQGQYDITPHRVEEALDRFVINSTARGPEGETGAPHTDLTRSGPPPISTGDLLESLGLQLLGDVIVLDTHSARSARPADTEEHTSEAALVKLIEQFDMPACHGDNVVDYGDIVMDCGDIVMDCGDSVMVTMSWTVVTLSWTGDIVMDCGDSVMVTMSWTKCHGDIVMDCGDIVMDCSDIVMDCGGIVMDCGDIVMECGDIVMDCGDSVMVTLSWTGDNVMDCGDIVMDCGDSVMVTLPWTVVTLSWTVVTCHGDNGMDCGDIVMDCGDIVMDCGGIVMDCGDIVMECGDIVMDCGDSVMVTLSWTGDSVMDCGVIVMDCGDSVMVTLSWTVVTLSWTVVTVSWNVVILF
ncbi:hypothetical protein ACOMHN_017473 [Nucella lapillus]